MALAKVKNTAYVARNCKVLHSVDISLTCSLLIIEILGIAGREGGLSVTYGQTTCT